MEEILITCKNKDFFDNLRSAKLLNCLSESRQERQEMQLKEFWEEVTRSRVLCKILINGLKNVPKNALKKWQAKLFKTSKTRNFTIMQDLLNFYSHFQRIQRRTMKEADERLVDLCSQRLK